MVQDQLFCVVMSDDSEVRGAGAELLGAYPYQISSWKDEESGNVRHTLYFNTEQEALEALAFLEKETPAWKEFGVDLSGFVCSVLKKENWAEAWKIHFKTLEISPRLIVRPSWEKYEPKPGQHVLVLDPGMSFGTGQHATTKSCMIYLDRFTQEAESQGKTLSMLDAGSGSGILAIAAYQLGCRQVRAFDIDPGTLPVARENARENGIPADGILFKAASLEAYRAPHAFDIVAANILSSALIGGREKLKSFVVPGGKLLLAGILDGEYEKVKAAFEEIGFVQIESRKEKEWRSGAFFLKF